jgi:hypothetical protein
MAKIAARLMTGRKLREFLPENIERQSRSRHRQLLFREVTCLPVGDNFLASTPCSGRR